MNYKSIADLNEDIKHWLGSLPDDIDLIVGIARSGLLPANILALHLNRPLTDIEGLLKGSVFSSGFRTKKKNDVFDSGKRLKILILDDSISTGRQMKLIKERLTKANIPHDLIYAAVYSTDKGTSIVDHYCQKVPLPRVFEWNIMHHEVIRNACVDIDGVLCVDPTEEQNDDGERYLDFLRNAEPLYIPSAEIGWLVTSRLEKYRQSTEEWLKKHGVRYRNLVMLDLPDKETRVSLNNHGEFKASVYTKSMADLFVESSLSQSLTIAQKTGKHVFCFDENQMIDPPFLKYIIAKARSKIDVNKPPIKPIYRMFQVVAVKSQVIIGGSSVH